MYTYDCTCKYVLVDTCIFVCLYVQVHVLYLYTGIHFYIHIIHMYNIICCTYLYMHTCTYTLYIPVGHKCINTYLNIRL